MTEPTYTIYIRVPIPRGNFVDPPEVKWNSLKDDALWKILSSSAKTELDWNQLASRFDVTVDFLLRQVAYLTDRHASQVREQVRKAAAAAKGSAAPSPIPGLDPSASSHQRTASSLSVRRDTPVSRIDTSTPVNTSLRPVITRNLSGGSGHPQHTAANSSTRLNTKVAHPRTHDAHLQQQQYRASTPLASAKPTEMMEALSPEPTESSMDESSDSSSSDATQSRIIRRPPRFPQRDVTSTFPDDDDTDPVFQPLQSESAAGSAQDLSSTVRENLRRVPRGRDRMFHSQTSDSSSTGSGAMPSRASKSDDRRPLGPLSPRRPAELAGRSPAGKSKESSKDGSDGTPSIGSSFSDLDDSSVTQSAMAEALAAGMQEGAIGSRLSLVQSVSRRFIPRKSA